MAAIFEVSALSTEYIRSRVTARDSDGYVDPTSGTAEFAFLSNNSNPASGDWETGSWETVGSKYYARCLIGPDGVATFSEGVYTVWIRITLSPETLVDVIGKLRVF